MHMRQMKKEKPMSNKNDVEKFGICHVIVHDVQNVPPSVERFRGLPDPYVKVFYHGNFR